MAACDAAKEPLNNSEVPRAMDGAPVDRARKGLIQRERSRALPDFAMSERHQDGVVQTFPKEIA
jgi:hypothetical protein